MDAFEQMAQPQDIERIFRTMCTETLKGRYTLEQFETNLHAYANQGMPQGVINKMRTLLTPVITAFEASRNAPDEFREELREYMESDVVQRAHLVAFLENAVYDHTITAAAKQAYLDFFDKKVVF